MPAQRFTGDGSEFHEGIPARDLTAAEYDALDADQQALVKASSLYEALPMAPAPKTASAPKADKSDG